MKTETLIAAAAVMFVMLLVLSFDRDPIESAPLEYNDQELAECVCNVARLGHAQEIDPLVRCTDDHDDRLIVPYIQRDSRLWNMCRSGTATARATYDAEHAERLALEVELEAELRRLRERVEAARLAEDAP